MIAGKPRSHSASLSDRRRCSSVSRCHLLSLG
jgi:hypothetical protein